MVAPDEIYLSSDKTSLTLHYGAEQFDCSAEFLRVSSPSAEVRGHGVGNEILQVGKKNVRILGLEPTGNYALKITFDDGHDSGLFTWDYLHHLSHNMEELWQDYLLSLQGAGASREAK